MADKEYQFNHSNFTNTEFINYNGKKILKCLGSIPVRPDVFIGRENSTKEIHEHFQGDAQKNLLLLVNGEGGIGKTTMASKYYHEFSTYYKHLIWLVSEKGIKEAIASLAFNFQLQFPPNFTLSQQVDEIIRYISDLKSPILLVIDNANDLKDLDESERVLRKFQNVDILITSRVDNYKNIESYKVAHLDKEAANKLFKQYYEAFQEEEQTLLDELLKAIGYNTLVIELLAKNLHEFNTALEAHYPLEKLLNDIQDKGLLKIQKSTEIHTFYKIKATTPEDIIKSMYNITPLSDNEKQILSIFGVLPATVLPYEDLKEFLPTIEMLDRVLIKLSQKGWIDYDEKVQSFKTNPIISEIVRTQNKERLEDDTTYLVELLINKLEYQPVTGHIDGDFGEIKKMVNYAETFVNHFDELNYNKSVVYERLGNFYKTYVNLEQALSFYESDMKLTKELYQNAPSNLIFTNGLALTHQNLGIIHESLGNLEQALTFYKDFMTLMEELYKINSNNITHKHNLAISYSQLGNIYSNLENSAQALSFFEKDMKLTKELYEKHPNNVGFKYNLAISYEKMGKIHSISGNSKLALSYFEEEVKLMEELYKKHPDNVSFKYNLAISYEKLGEIYIVSGNYEEALSYFKDEVKLMGELYKKNPENGGFKNGLAITYAKLGHLFIGELNKKKTGIPYLQKAHALWKELTEKNPNHAEFLNNYAWVVDKLKSLKETYT